MQYVVDAHSVMPMELKLPRLVQPRNMDAMEAGAASVPIFKPGATKLLRLELDTNI